MVVKIMRYFLYARKSTDKEDMQVLSIEAQLSELRLLAKREVLEVIAEFVEKQSAKQPGRPFFNEMIERVRKGEADGIICWKLDRLARNPVDSGQVSWLLQSEVLKHICTPERSYYSNDSVLLMSVEFGMANQYVRDLAYNTSRGLRAKARRGEYPAPAPVGYINNPVTKRIEIDRKKGRVIREAFELYAKNGSRYEDIAQFLYDHGVRSRAKKRWPNGGGKAYTKVMVVRMFNNPLYYGDFVYKGETYHGTHTPLITKEIFDRVHSVMRLRGRIQKHTKAPRAFCGLLKCGSCGCSITAETLTKKQQNGNVHRYTYYRCTKKRGACAEPFVREGVLEKQLSETLALYALPESWAKEMCALADKDEKDASISARAAVQEMRRRVADLDTKLARVTDLYIEQDIDRDTYLERRSVLMSERKTLSEQSEKLERDSTAWLEPLRNWITEAQSLNEIATSGDSDAQKSFLQKIFSSNLTLTAREARGTATFPWDFIRGVKEKASGGDQVSYGVGARGLEPLTLSTSKKCSTN